MVMLMHMATTRSMAWGEDGYVNGMMMVMLLRNSCYNKPTLLFICYIFKWFMYMCM